MDFDDQCAQIDRELSDVLFALGLGVQQARLKLLKVSGQFRMYKSGAESSYLQVMECGAQRLEESVLLGLDAQIELVGDVEEPCDGLEFFLEIWQVVVDARQNGQVLNKVLH